jgi:dTDP-4-dehydrorhamnose 3,5-epimerase/reductase
VTNYGKASHASTIPSPRWTVLNPPVHGDSGWFKEYWQSEKMMTNGLPAFGPVQNNVSFNDAVGTTRGICGEPWDKSVSIASRRTIRVSTADIDPSRAVFLRCGVAMRFSRSDLTPPAPTSSTTPRRSELSRGHIARPTPTSSRIDV